MRKENNKNKVELKDKRKAEYIESIVNNCEGGSITSNPRH